jgi:hypothetical protein
MEVNNAGNPGEWLCLRIKHIQVSARFENKTGNKNSK